jgi:hypothetical protein
MLPRKSLAVVVVALLAVVVLPTVAQARQSIRGPGFRTYAPSGWAVVHTNANGWRTTTISSPGSQANNPAASTVVTVSSIPARSLQKRSHRRLPRDLAKLLMALITIPNGAGSSQAQGPPRAMTLDGVLGATIQYRFSQASATVSQTTTVLRRRGRVYFLQVVAGLAVSQFNGAANSMVMDAWRWR